MSKGIRFTDEFKQDAVAQVVGLSCQRSTEGRGHNAIASELTKSKRVDSRRTSSRGTSQAFTRAANACAEFGNECSHLRRRGFNDAEKSFGTDVPKPSGPEVQIDYPRGLDTTLKARTALSCASARRLKASQAQSMFSPETIKVVCKGGGMATRYGPAGHGVRPEIGHCAV